MADTTAIVCPHCQKSFKGNPNLAGKKIRCKSCEKAFVVPGGSAAAPPSLPGKAKPDEAAAVAAAALDDKPAKADTVSLANEEEDEGGAYAATTLDLTARCPNCANPLESEDAVVCLYCGYNTQTRTWGKTEQTYETTFFDYFIWLLPGILCLLAIVVQVIGCLYYCLVLPKVLGTSAWWSWSTHESLRMWNVIIALFSMWPLGYFCYLRLVLHPNPPEKKKE